MSVQSQLAAGECSRWQDYLDDQMKKGEEMKQGIRIEGEQEITTHAGSGGTKVEGNSSPFRDVALLIGMTEDGLQQQSIN